MLIDGGSSVDMLFSDTFRRIGFSDEWLQLGEEPLVGFDGKPSSPLLQVNFIVVDAILVYNAILEKSWIHHMEGMASSLHQVFRCRAVDEIDVAKIQGDQLGAKRCALTMRKLIKRKTMEFEDPNHEGSCQTGNLWWSNI